MIQNYRDRECAIFSAAKTLKESPAVNPKNVKGSLWSDSEMIVDPREAIAKLPHNLMEKYGVEFHFNTVISNISYLAYIVAYNFGKPTKFMFVVAQILKLCTPKSLQKPPCQM